MDITKEQLEKYKSRTEAAQALGVSERTVIRWQKRFGLYEPKANYGCNKITDQQADEIRRRREAGEKVKDLATEFGVTFVTISRIVNGRTHKRNTETAIVSAIYNPK